MQTRNSRQIITFTLLEEAKEVRNWNKRKKRERFIFTDGGLVTNHPDQAQIRIKKIETKDEEVPYQYYALFSNQTFQEVITWQARINNKINELNPTGKNNFKLIKDWREKTGNERLVAPSKELYEEDHEIDGNNEDIEIIGTKKKKFAIFADKEEHLYVVSKNSYDKAQRKLKNNNKDTSLNDKYKQTTLIENINIDLAQEVSNWTALEGLNRFVFNDGELVKNHADITTIKEKNENGETKYYAIPSNNIPQEVFTDLIYKINKLSKNRNKFFRVMTQKELEKATNEKRFVYAENYGEIKKGSNINANDPNIKIVEGGKGSTKEYYIISANDENPKRLMRYYTYRMANPLYIMKRERDKADPINEPKNKKRKTTHDESTTPSMSDYSASLGSQHNNFENQDCHFSIKEHDHNIGLQSLIDAIDQFTEPLFQEIEIPIPQKSEPNIITEASFIPEKQNVMISSGKSAFTSKNKPSINNITNLDEHGLSTKTENNVVPLSESMHQITELPPLSTENKEISTCLDPNVFENKSNPETIVNNTSDNLAVEQHTAQIFVTVWDQLNKVKLQRGFSNPKQEVILEFKTTQNEIESFVTYLNLPEIQQYLSPILDSIELERVSSQETVNEFKKVIFRFKEPVQFIYDAVNRIEKKIREYLGEQFLMPWTAFMSQTEFACSFHSQSTVATDLIQATQVTRKRKREAGTDAENLSKKKKINENLIENSQRQNTDRPPNETTEDISESAGIFELRNIFIDTWNRIDFNEEHWCREYSQPKQEIGLLVPMVWGKVKSFAKYLDILHCVEAKSRPSLTTLEKIVLNKTTSSIILYFTKPIKFATEVKSRIEQMVNSMEKILETIEFSNEVIQPSNPSSLQMELNAEKQDIEKEIANLIEPSLDQKKSDHFPGEQSKLGKIMTIASNIPDTDFSNKGKLATNGSSDATIQNLLTSNEFFSAREIFRKTFYSIGIDENIWYDKFLEPMNNFTLKFQIQQNELIWTATYLNFLNYIQTRKNLPAIFSEIKINMEESSVIVCFIKPVESMLEVSNIIKKMIESLDPLFCMSDPMFFSQGPSIEELDSEETLNNASHRHLNTEMDDVVNPESLPEREYDIPSDNKQPEIDDGEVPYLAANIINEQKKEDDLALDCYKYLMGILQNSPLDIQMLKRIDHAIENDHHQNTEIPSSIPTQDVLINAESNVLPDIISVDNNEELTKPNIIVTEDNFQTKPPSPILAKMTFSALNPFGQLTEQQADIEFTDQMEPSNSQLNDANDLYQRSENQFEINQIQPLYFENNENWNINVDYLNFTFEMPNAENMYNLYPSSTKIQNELTESPQNIQPPSHLEFSNAVENDDQTFSSVNLTPIGSFTNISAINPPLDFVEINRNQYTNFVSVDIACSSNEPSGVNESIIFRYAPYSFIEQFTEVVDWRDKEQFKGINQLILVNETRRFFKLLKNCDADFLSSIEIKEKKNEENNTSDFIALLPNRTICDVMTLLDYRIKKLERKHNIIFKIYSKWKNFSAGKMLVYAEESDNHKFGDYVKKKDDNIEVVVADEKTKTPRCYMISLKESGLRVMGKRNLARRYHSTKKSKKNSKLSNNYSMNQSITFRAEEDSFINQFTEVIDWKNKEQFKGINQLIFVNETRRSFKLLKDCDVNLLSVMEIKKNGRKDNKRSFIAILPDKTICDVMMLLDYRIKELNRRFPHQVFKLIDNLENQVEEWHYWERGEEHESPYQSVNLRDPNIALVKVAGKNAYAECYMVSVSGECLQVVTKAALSQKKSRKKKRGDDYSMESVSENQNSRKRKRENRVDEISMPVQQGEIASRPAYLDYLIKVGFFGTSHHVAQSQQTYQYGSNDIPSVSNSDQNPVSSGINSTYNPISNTTATSAPETSPQANEDFSSNMQILQDQPDSNIEMDDDFLGASHPLVQSQQTHQDESLDNPSVSNSDQSHFLSEFNDETFSVAGLGYFSNTTITSAPETSPQLNEDNPDDNTQVLKDQSDSNIGMGYNFFY